MTTENSKEVLHTPKLKGWSKKIIREYNEAMHQPSGLSGEDLYTIDESEVSDFEKWKKDNGHEDKVNEWLIDKDVEEVLHTQGEWTIQDEIYGLFDESTTHKAIYCGSNWIADCGPKDNGDSLPNAELIVKAVNAFPIISFDLQRLATENEELKNERQKLLDSNRELIEALKPFAEMFGEFTESKVRQQGEVFAYNDKKLNVADFFAALTAINNAKNT